MASPRSTRTAVPRRALAGLLLAALAVASVPWARASASLADELRAAWKQHDPQRAQHARYSMALREGDFDTLAKGDHVARIVRSEADGDRVVGALHAELPIAALWAAVQNTEARDTGQGVTQTLLPGSSAQRRLLYLYMDSPWPIQNRQAVVDVRYNGPLYAATDGELWERSWRVGDPALAVTSDPEAIWMPTNEGAWQMVRLDESRTLMVLSLRVDVGGVVPTEVGVRWGVATLGSIIRGIVDNAEQLVASPPSGPIGVNQPDGVPITRF